MNSYTTKARFNIADLALILLVAFILIGGAYRLFFTKERIESYNQEIVYTVLIENANDYTLRALKVGDSVTESKTGIQLGKIIKIQSRPWQQPAVSSKGVWRLSEVPGKVLINLQIKSLAVVTPANTAIGNRKIKVGQQISLETATLATKGVISDVRIYGERQSS